MGRKLKLNQSSGDVVIGISGIVPRREHTSEHRLYATEGAQGLGARLTAHMPSSGVAQFFYGLRQIWPLRRLAARP